MSLMSDFTDSWITEEGIYSDDEILSWIKNRNSELYVEIKKIHLESCRGWFYDETTGSIHNENNSFFNISGLRRTDNDNILEQPIIIQDEIGYLGILCKKIKGILHFLMQAKIEPGNINVVQISPTIQATKSNFTQKHGGKKPPYIDYFLNVDPDCIIVDQLQSEQSSRFLKKRNRNIIIYIDENSCVDMLPSHRWMTLGQIKTFMKIDNLVNMDTRTVLSCIPYSLFNYDICPGRGALYASVCAEPEREKIVYAYNYINDIKMFQDSKTETLKLFSLKEWQMVDGEFICTKGYPFKLIFCDINIEGREVKQWCQPLFEATGQALFGIFIREKNGVLEFLVSIKQEIGCFDVVEFSPTVQTEYGFVSEEDPVLSLFYSKLKRRENIIFDALLSEEGGRFYHEENRNVIIKVNENELIELPRKYMWCNFATLNLLTQVNNCLNIQLRNMLSLLEL